MNSPASVPSEQTQTDYVGVFFAAAFPIVISVGLLYEAFFGHAWAWSQVWILGLILLLPLEFLRTVVLSSLADAYKQNKSTSAMAKSFLLSMAILIVLLLGWGFLRGGIKNTFQFIAQPFVWQGLGLPLLVMMLDGAVGILAFSGDRQKQAVRLKTIAEDSIDWFSIMVARVPFLILGGFIIYAVIRRGNLPAFAPDSGARGLMMYFGVYFIGKAFVAAYPHTARFAATGKRLFDTPWMRRVRGKSAQADDEESNTTGGDAIGSDATDREAAAAENNTPLPAYLKGRPTRTTRTAETWQVRANRGGNMLPLNVQREFRVDTVAGQEISTEIRWYMRDQYGDEYGWARNGLIKNMQTNHEFTFLGVDGADTTVQQLDRIDAQIRERYRWMHWT